MAVSNAPTSPYARSSATRVLPPALCKSFEAPLFLTSMAELTLEDAGRRYESRRAHHFRACRLVERSETGLQSPRVPLRLSSWQSPESRRVWLPGPSVS